MKKILSAVTLVVLILFIGCSGVVITGSKDLKTETFEFSDFTRIEAHNGFQVELTKSNTFSVKITADENLYEYLRVTKSGDTLEMGLQPGRIYTSVTLKAKITMPDVYRIDLSGGSQADITGFSSSEGLSVELSGGSGISGDITAGDAEFNLSGGSHVTLEGAADDVNIDGSGGSQLQLRTFQVKDVDITLSGGGRATVNMSGILDVNLSGGSHVGYFGEPKLGDVNLSGGSSIGRE